VKLCKWEKEEDNVLRLTESYMDLNADAVKRIAGVKR